MKENSVLEGLMGRWIDENSVLEDSRRTPPRASRRHAQFRGGQQLLSQTPPKLHFLMILNTAELRVENCQLMNIKLVGISNRKPLHALRHKASADLVTFVFNIEFISACQAATRRLSNAKMLHIYREVKSMSFPEKHVFFVDHRGTFGACPACYVGPLGGPGTL